MESLFERLRKKVNIPEDFVTEALRGVLLAMSDNDLNSFLTNLLNQDIRLLQPQIITQFASSTERYDIIVTDNSHYIIFENKWDSASYLEQLMRYDLKLTEISKKNKFLVHLTKDYEQIDNVFVNPFIKIAWSDVYKNLLPFKSSYLISEFILFLKNEGITMDKVTWELIEGTKSLNALQQLVARASEENGFTVNWRGGSSANSEILIHKKLYAYFFYDKAELAFCVYEPYNIGLKPFSNKVRGGENWSCVLFDFDQHNFFHRSYEEQLLLLKNFIKDLMAKIESFKPSENES